MTHTEGDRPAMSEATNMGAERGPSREEQAAIDWARQNVPMGVFENKAATTEARYLASRGYLAGREAAMAQTCEWRWQTEDDGPVEGWLPGCGGPEQAGDFYEGYEDEVWPFCQHCGGRIVVAAQDRG